MIQRLVKARALFPSLTSGSQPYEKLWTRTHSGDPTYGKSLNLGHPILRMAFTKWYANASSLKRCKPLRLYGNPRLHRSPLLRGPRYCLPNSNRTDQMASEWSSLARRLAGCKRSCWVAGPLCLLTPPTWGERPAMPLHSIRQPSYRLYHNL